jgi:hypothetical protein
MVHIGKLVGGVLLCAGAALATGCGNDNPVNAVENRITCKDVCQRYSDCFDHSYDVDGCTDRCTNDSLDSSEKDAKLDACNSCIKDHSCAPAVFSCGSDCGSFVP